VSVPIRTEPARLELIALAGVPTVAPGDDIAALTMAALAHANVQPREHDVLVVAQKIVSKAEGRAVELRSVEPSERAVALGRETNKDPRLVELILSETRRIVRSGPDVLIVEHRLGFVGANAGVDQSNVGPQDGVERALLLPRDPDASAEALRTALVKHHGVNIGVVINDSFGRPWRLGTAGVALGVAGLPALKDLRGRPDYLGRPLKVSITAFADEIAAAASLLMGQGDEGRPMVLVRGLDWHEPASPARALLRPTAEDLFR
jgi:coenzyme F420-0:L-glutamate ligase / coenzyme F420-1:gamma-L-glutamate ligase